MNLKGNYHVYKSSAGSGKTFTLAKFYLTLILKNPSPDYFKHILAITFTVKAAAEMKNRIIHYLSGFASKEKMSTDHELMIGLIESELGLNRVLIQKKSRHILNGILHDYSSLYIFTIDKFVHKLVRSFASELGLNPDFEVEIDSKQLVERVISETLDKVGQDAEITELILKYTKEQVDSDKYWDVTENLESLAFNLNSEDFFLNAKSLTNLSPSAIFKIQKELRAKIQNAIQIAQDMGRQALEIIENSGLDQKDFAYGFKGVYGFFKWSECGDLDKITSPNIYVLKALEEGKWQSGTKSPIVIDIQSKLHSLLSEIIERLADFREAIFYKKLIPQLYKTGLINEFQSLFAVIKENENQQLLSDFYKLLSEKFNEDHTPFIFERLGNKYHHILIDEFQDTSQLQWENLLPLVENSLAEGHSSLVVGDAKQSIYRFRGSEPSQFINQPINNRSTDPLFKAEFNPHILDSNYRSADAIVQFNNRFFAELSDSYLALPEQEYYSDLTQITKSKLKGSVSLTAIEKQDDISIQDTLFEEITNSIRRLIKSERVEPGDICLLFQKNVDASYFAGRLLECDFPVTSDESLLLALNPKVQLIISTIQAAANPHDAFFLQLWLSRLNQVVGFKRDYHSVASWVKNEKVSFNRLAKELNLGFSENSFHQDSFRNVWELTTRYGLPKKDVFIKSLLDFSLLYDENATYLKTSFIESWESNVDSLSIENSNKNSIQVMTIHKSKGLEFPHVFVYLPEFQQRKTTKKYAWVNGLEIDSIDKSLIEIGSLKNTNYEGILEREKAKTSVDLLNSLYVALTRPKETLNIYTLAKNGEIISKPLRFIQNWEEWSESNSTLVIRS